MSEWSHLPNAVHIDRILAHLKAYPEKWTVTRSVAHNAAWDAAHNAAWDTAHYAARSAAWYATRNAAWGAIRTAAWGAAFNAARGTIRTAAYNAAWDASSGAILALIANDTCGYLLKEKIEHVDLLAGLGQPEAILLLPAVRAMSHE
jgi:hypothetical protein